MSWRYDVFECTNETDDHSTCEAMTGPPVDILWDGRWKDAYRKAEELPHGVVESRYMGDQGWSKTPHVVFEHIEGGGLCYFCGKGRGPLCRAGDGDRFLCEPCRKAARDQHSQWARNNGTTPSRFTYVPIIETLNYNP